HDELGVEAFGFVEALIHGEVAWDVKAAATDRFAYSHLVGLGHRRACQAGQGKRERRCDSGGRMEHPHATLLCEALSAGVSAGKPTARGVAGRALYGSCRCVKSYAAILSRPHPAADRRIGDMWPPTNGPTSAQRARAATQGRR